MKLPKPIPHPPQSPTLTWAKSSTVHSAETTTKTSDPSTPHPSPPIITTSFPSRLPFFSRTIVIPTPGGSAAGVGQTPTVLDPSSFAFSGTTIFIGGGPLTIISHPSAAAAAEEGGNANIMILSLAPENKPLIGTVLLASQQPQPLPTTTPPPPEEVLFRAREYSVTRLKNTDIRGGGGGGSWGFIIINDQTLTPGGRAGFISTTSNNKLIIGHETFTIPLFLLPPTLTPTRITKKIALPNGDVLPLDIISGGGCSGGVMVVIWWLCYNYCINPRRRTRLPLLQSRLLLVVVGITMVVAMLKFFWGTG